MHETSCFLTLTYSDENLPDDCSVSVRPLQLFMKRLRKRFGSGVRFFACGEYGDANNRPHYHVILFGCDFADKTLWRRTSAGYYTFRSAVLEGIWTLGHSEIGEVTQASCAYVARYVIKKINGERAEEHYTRVHAVTGEVFRVKPEFICMSKGIGGTWFDKFATDCFPSDFVVIDGCKRPVPRYYTKKMAELDALEVERIKYERSLRAEKHSADNTPERLAVRERVLRDRMARFKREVDEEE